MKKITNSTKLPKITTKQKDILLLLYKFRFLTTTHIQKLFNHKNPKRIQSWLKDLLDKGYINRSYSRKDFEQNTKPAIYYLAPKARQIISGEKAIDLGELEYIYKENRRSSKFINHNLSLVDVYLYLLSQKEISEELKFFTKAELQGYEYFPDPLPDAFIALKGKDTSKRYFLDLFDEYTPPFVLRTRVRNYLEYVEKPDWDENTDYTLLPSILFVVPSESIKKHIYMYTKALLEKYYEDKVSIFLTTKTKIQFDGKNNIWQKVE